MHEDKIKEIASNLHFLCELIENHKNYERINFLSQCKLLLANIYYLGHFLPYIDLPDNIEVGSYGHENWFKLNESLEIYLNGINNYYRVLELFKAENPTLVTISNDLSEIVEDMKPALILYESNIDKNIQAAIWKWKLTYWHWGEHILNVLKPLHEIISDNQD